MFLDEIIPELKKFGISELERKTGLARSHIYGILNRKTDPSLETIGKLLGPLGYEVSFKRRSLSDNIREHRDNEKFIVWSLSEHGAPLLTREQFSSYLDLNDTIILALEQGRKNSQINAILPLFIFKNRNKIDWKRVKRRVSDRRYLAYILNLILHLTNDLDVSDQLRELRNEIGPIRQTQRLIKSGKMSEFEKRKLDAVENMIARSWKFTTADSLKGIENRFRKWMTLET